MSTQNKTTTDGNDLHVVFGTGPLGQAVACALIRRGKRVRMVNRSGKRPDDISADVEVLAGNAYQADFTRQVTTGATVVYQCAQPAYDKWTTEFPPLQQSILEGTAASGAKLIVGENLYMYGEVAGPIRENLPYTAQTRKGKVRGEMSQALLAAHRDGKVRVAMARGSDFYGPGVLESALGARAIKPALQDKTASLGGNLDVPHTYTVIDDFGEAMAILGERDEALGQAWHVPNPTTLTQRKLMTLFFKEIDLPPKMSSLSRLMMSLAGLFVAAARESVEMMYEFEKPFIVDSSKFVHAFGDISTSHEQAIKATVAWYRAHVAA